MLALLSLVDADCRDFPWAPVRVESVLLWDIVLFYASLSMMIGFFQHCSVASHDSY